LKTAALSTATLAVEVAVPQGKADNAMIANAAKLARREYKPGVELSIIGFGGIVVMGSDQEHANRVVAEAIEKGVNYFDVAPSYGNGEAEIKLGPALKPYRKEVFLACKTGMREREAGAAELARSLERAHTDYFDLYQLHGITDVENDVDKPFMRGGLMDFLIGKKKEGVLRHLGFSAHSVEAAFAAMDRYEFDSVLFPMNFTNALKGHFGPQILERAKSQGVARLALKAMARQAWPKDDPDRQKFNKCWYQPLTDPREANLGIRWTLSQAVTSAVPPGDEALWRMAVDVALNFKPITKEETDELVSLAQTLTPIFHTA
jgi:predicted aldo/keto reductase-like oxidoreductase